MTTVSSLELTTRIEVEASFDGGTAADTLSATATADNYNRRPIPAAPAAPAAHAAPVFRALAYRPELDGLRAFAVVPVIFYHFKVPVLFTSGFAGVDVFFVLSGFLITSILLADLARGTFSYRRFFGRRVRRLFPALALVLLVVLTAGWFTVFAGTAYRKVGHQATATLVGGANFFFSGDQDYFADDLGNPLLHCWSLAVEEQFYVLWPLLLWALWRCSRCSSHLFCFRARRAGRSGTRRSGTGGRTESRPESPGCIGAALTAVTAASLTVAISTTALHSGAVSNFAFYLLPARAWEMAAGGLLALDQGWSPFDSAPAASSATSSATSSTTSSAVTSSDHPSNDHSTDHAEEDHGTPKPTPYTKRMKHRVAAEVASWAGLAMVLVSCCVFDPKNTPWPSYPTLLPVCGTALLIASQRPRRTSCGAFLASKPIVFVGKASYSIYLWHCKCLQL